VDVNNTCLRVCCETEPDEPELGNFSLIFGEVYRSLHGREIAVKNGVNPQGQSVEMGGTPT